MTTPRKDPSQLLKEGRKPKYDFQKAGGQQFLTVIEGMASNVLNLSDIAAILNIRPETLSRYRRRFPEFDQAIKTGRAKLKASVTRNLIQSAKDGDFQAQKFILTNISDDWHDKKEHDVRVGTIVVRPPRDPDLPDEIEDQRVIHILPEPEDDEDQ